MWYYWLGYVVIGLVAGWIGGLIVKGSGSGWLINLIVGVIGAILGGWLLGLVGLTGHGLIWTLLSAIAGAVVLLLIVGLVMRKKA
jgi:uncharacterized membrane protein YeaQ/YmgE (transglycosylase-associated protein family)